MRQLLPTIGLLLLAIPATAQDAPPWANKFFTSKDDAPPRVIVQDFGTLPKGTVRTYRFTMTNIYAVAMDVAEPKPSCGCVSIVAYTGRMEPRETGFVDIKIDTSRVEGFKRVDVPVRFVGKHPKTGEPFYSTANLEIRTVSRPDILMNPGAFAFNVVPLKQKSTQVITVAYSGRMRGWKITDVGYKKELLDVTVEPLATRTGVSYQVTATPDSNLFYEWDDEASTGLGYSAGQSTRVLYEVNGGGFLRHMVRIIVGTLVEIGRGRRSAAWMGEVLASRDRALAGPTAPPDGLFLVGVEYDSGQAES